MQQEKLSLFKPAFISVCLLCLVLSTAGQDRTMVKNAFFAEYTLEGPVYSINYERIFLQSRTLNVDFRAGFSITNNKIAFPVGLGFFTGHGDHHAEFSFTATPLVEHKRVAYGSGSDYDKLIYLFPAAGYRYQRSSGGISLKAMAGPAIILDPADGDFWNMDPKVKFSFSLGAGWSFGR
jgi:hypothetical protein